MEPVAKAAGLVAAIYFPAQSRLLLRESQEAIRGESLGRLSGGAVDLTGDDVLIGVDIKPKLDNLGDFLNSLL
jgi:hypothetical protein|tara:strand:+ start:162 stop:380 length:219 start_codon:yes stop_codon:yes gene_type:complete